MMAMCKDCLALLEHSEWGAKVVNRELLPLAQSTDRCPLCRHLCDFFEIPVESIRKGAVWPSMEEMRSTDNADISPQPPGHVLERFVAFKVIWDREKDLRRILAELIPRGSRALHPGPREAHLPLSWDSANYRDSSSTLGVCMNSAGMLAIPWSKDIYFSIIIVIMIIRKRDTTLIE